MRGSMAVCGVGVGWPGAAVACPPAAAPELCARSYRLASGMEASRASRLSARMALRKPMKPCGEAEGV
jgi:hypothetical protein